MHGHSARALVIACAAVALAVAVVATAVVDSGGADEPRPGLVFSADAGDAVDVEVFLGTESRYCTHVSSFHYPSTTGCFTLDDVAAAGSYEVVIPTSNSLPPLVVGVMPDSATSAYVRVGKSIVRAKTRGRWFLAPLEPGALGPDNSASVTVRFSVHL